jgi:hypothetical protein
VKRRTSILQAIRELIASHRERTMKDRVNDAVKAHAKACSDVEYHRVMTDFYTDRAKRTDPWKDHNGFAEARNSEQEHEAEWIDAKSDCEEAAARLAAEQARYVQLHDGLTENGP